jgi:SAM-dependent methyltransferase
LLPVAFKVMGRTPSSVVDVGCGNGGWLKAAKELGVQRILGMDYNDGLPAGLDSDLVIPLEFYRQVDLRNPSLPSVAPFELVICLEVAEHLHPQFAEGLISFLVGLTESGGEVGPADGKILFSAASPGQGPYGEEDNRGVHHNERPMSYWAVLFAQYGYIVRDAIRPRIRSQRLVQAIDPWYRSSIRLVERSR